MYGYGAQESFYFVDVELFQCIHEINAYLRVFAKTFFYRTKIINNKQIR